MENVTQTDKKVNMALYDAYRTVPETAKKTISAGRLKGMTDINPMWRIQSLTEAFGPCGVGWYAEILNQWIDGGSNGEAVANVRAALYVKVNGEWSRPIVGIGGSRFVAKEGGGLYTSDEAYKMAYTDAISVCCKMLGFGADVYWAAGRTKYTAQPDEPKTAGRSDDPCYVCENCGERLKAVKDKGGNVYGLTQIAESTKKSYGKILCWKCAVAEGEKRSAANG